MQGWWVKEDEMCVKGLRHRWWAWWVEREVSRGVGIWRWAEAWVVGVREWNGRSELWCLTRGPKTHPLLFLEGKLVHYPNFQ